GEDGEADLATGSEDEPVIKLVDTLLADALASRASDLHIEPEATGLRVRLRIDGLLREVRRLPRNLGRQVTSRLKIMGRLDIAERRMPQDGRALARVDGNEIDLRVSTMPTMYGETVVLRLLPRGAERLELDQLGLPASARAALTDALERPQGLVLVTGPTGSGKTSTLYAALAAVTDPTRNVLTLEDPVEVQLPGVNQTQIEPRIGLTFARGLRHVLRQDPDVVLVGEIRDEETASLAVEASFTGHLVLATLHTNDAPSAIARLSNLGADSFLVASSLLLVVGQRLARRTCSDCAVDDQPEPQLLQRSGLSEQALTQARLRRGTGCSTCEHTGISGRTAIGEVLPVSGALRDLIVEHAPERRLALQARREGVPTLRDQALERAVAGEITLAEALRVTPDPTDVPSD
ncbi:MAG: GspE/PulE family protein, partial [Nitriliruptoraceae bacterium]